MFQVWKRQPWLLNAGHHKAIIGILTYVQCISCFSVFEVQSTNTNTFKSNSNTTNTNTEVLDSQVWIIHICVIITVIPAQRGIPIFHFGNLVMPSKQNKIRVLIMKHLFINSIFVYKDLVEYMYVYSSLVHRLLRQQRKIPWIVIRCAK